MMLSENKTTETSNPFKEAYNTLNDRDQLRVRNVICAACCISATTFYEWLKNPTLVKSHNDKLLISAVFNKDVKELFTKK